MTSIKCGKCSATHASIAEVRACYGQPTAAATAATVSSLRAAVSPVVPVTEKQAAFIARLRAGRGLEVLPFTGSKAQASIEIKRLLALPQVAPVTPASPTAPSAPTVADGRYAIEVDGTVKFYVVKSPTEGRWAGRTFVSVQASDDLHPVRGSSATAVLTAIAADAHAALIRYGHLLGQCGKCGRTLTDASSREAGIGPICASKI